MKLQSKLLMKIKGHLQKYRLYILAREIKWILEKHLKTVSDLHERVVSLKPEGPSKGNVLISYISDAFYLRPGEPMPNSHTNYWEAVQIARTYLDLGYSVDVISRYNETFVPRKTYAVFTAIRKNFQRIAPLLNKDCIKILHIDGAHWLFHNTAELRRHLELQQRRGITLTGLRLSYPNLAIEKADCATILGNEFTVGTHRFANKRMYRVPVSTPCLYPWQQDKDFDTCRRRFLWLGSGALVHKGLDLVLEAFAEMPEYHLTVCGPIQEDRDFKRAFYKELYCMSNIYTVGWVDVASGEFVEIAKNCVGLIYPSSSEGQSGGVVTCLHAGLIPIISYESGVDITDEFGIVLRECSIQEIRKSIQEVSERSSKELRVMARKAWEFARANHTRERFAEEYRNIVAHITGVSVGQARLSHSGHMQL